MDFLKLSLNYLSVHNIKKVSGKVIIIYLMIVKLMVRLKSVAASYKAAMIF